MRGKIVLVGKAAVIPVNFDIPAKRRQPAVLGRVARRFGKLVTGRVEIAPVERAPRRDKAHIERTRVEREALFECRLSIGRAAERAERRAAVRQ